jgi:WD40 repeat protein
MKRGASKMRMKELTAGMGTGRAWLLFNPPGGLFAVSLALALWSVFFARAAAPPAGQACDLTGDLLPAGAVARLGSTRLSQPEVVCMTFAPDGRVLATVDDLGTVRSWEVATGKLRWRAETVRFQGRAANWSLLCFSPDGKLLALAAQENGVRVWSVADGRERRLAVPLRPSVVRFSPDGRQLAIGLHRHRLYVWDVKAQGAPVPLGDVEGTSILAYDRGGKELITIGVKSAKELECAVWSLPGGKLARRHGVPWDSHFAPHLAADGRFLAIPDNDGTRIRLYDPATGKLLRRTGDQANWPRGLAFAADGSAMTATSKDGMASVWGTQTGKLLQRFQGLPGVIRLMALSPDGKVLALAGRGGSGDEVIRFWDLSVPLPRLTAGDWGHGHGPLTVAFAADGKTVFTASREPKNRTPALDGVGWSLRRWEPSTGRQLAVMQEYTGGEVRWTKFSPDGRQLAVVTHEGTLRLWSTESARELRRWKVPTRDFGWVDTAGKVVQRFPQAALGVLAFGANGKEVLATHGAAIHRWDVSTGKPLETFQGWEKRKDEQPGLAARRWLSDGWVVPLPDGETLLLVSSDRNSTHLLLGSLRSGRTLREWAPQPRRFHFVAAVSPDGRALAMPHSDPNKAKVILLVEVASGRQRAELVGAPPYIEELAFSPDGRLLACGCGWSDNIVRVWDLAQEGKLHFLKGHEGSVTSLAFSPDGRLLASAGRETSALLWDVHRLTIGRALPQGKVAPVELEQCWRDLCGSDATRAYAAIRRLARSSRQSVPLLGERLRSLPPTDARHVGQLIAQLDDEVFAQREQASEMLTRLGDAAEPALRQAARSGPSLEARRRAERVLTALENPDRPASPRLIALRALEVLEMAADTEARKLIDNLSRATVSDEVLRAAADTARRLQKRRSDP